MDICAVKKIFWRTLNDASYQELDVEDQYR